MHQGHDVVPEVDSAPGLIGIERATSVDVAGAIAALVADRLASESGVV